MEDILTEKQNIQTQAQDVFSSTRIFRLLILCILFLVSISTFLSYLKFQVLSSNKNILNIGLTFFSLDREKNIPTYFSSFILLCSSFLLILIFFLEKDHKKKKYYWLSLGIIFLVLSLDEFVGFHEFTAGPIVDNFNVSGFLYMGWVIPAIFIVISLGAFFLRFLLSLNRTTRNLFIFSAVLYLGGAIGLEMIGGYLMENIGVDNFTYALSTNIEEMLEMSGISFFIYSLLNYIHLIKPNGFYISVKR